jgi:hypothetical protein
LASFSVASGSGWPGLVGGAADRAVSISNQVQRVQHLDGLGDDFGPMPSPGRTAIFMLCVSLFFAPLSRQAVVQPGHPGRAAFEGLDLVGVAQGQADVVEAVEQAVLAEGSMSKGSSPPRLDHHLALRSMVSW